MTLFTLVIDNFKSNRQARKTLISYSSISIFCVIFDKIYALFGHGVSSYSMSLMFLYPLLGGVLPFLILWLLIPKSIDVVNYRFSYNSHNSGIAALTTGSLLNGIFEIAGTSSPYMIIFTVCGVIMVTTGVLTYIYNSYKYKKSDFLLK